MFRIFFALLIAPSILLAVKSKEESKRLTLEIQKKEAAGEKLFNDQRRMQLTQSNSAPQRCYSDTALLRLLMKKSNKSTIIKSK